MMTATEDAERGSSGPSSEPGLGFGFGGRLSALISGMSSNGETAAAAGLLCSSSSSFSSMSATGDNATMEKKSDEIQRCLSGTVPSTATATAADESDESSVVVDLWHLRTLSLSAGGLLNSTLRKRCWPKLLGLDEAILLNSSNSTSTSSALMSSDGGSIRSMAVTTLAIQSALTTTKNKNSTTGNQQQGLLWDVEGMIKSQRRTREAERAMLLRSRLGDNDDANTGAEENDAASVESTAATDISSSASVATVQKLQTKGKKMTKQELSILTNILAAVCQHTALDAKTADPTIIRQLANLSALLLINLESPSLTSLMMQSLAKEHLNIDTACMRIASGGSGGSGIEEMVDNAFWTLLDCNDEKMGGMMRDMLGDTDGGNNKSFVANWITSWFASALPTGLGSVDAATTSASSSNSIASIELEVASRFLDVFLCSHPYMPIYVSAAMVMHPINRKIVADAGVACSDDSSSSSSSSADILANLPSAMMASILGITDEVFFDDTNGRNIEIAEDRRAELMAVVEEIVSEAIELMRIVPPTKLVETSTTVPEYMLKASAQTDFALIRQAKEARSRQITAVAPLLATLSPMSEASTPTSSPNSVGNEDDTKSSKFDFSDEAEIIKSTAIAIPTDEKYSLAVIAAGMSQSARPNVQSIKAWSACMTVYVVGLAVAISLDRFIVDVMSEASQSSDLVASSPVPAVVAKASAPTTISNALIPTSEVYDATPKPISSVVVSTLKLESVEQAFVHGASYIGSTIGPVFGPVFSDEVDVDLDDNADTISMKHQMGTLENLIAGALPMTYYF